MEPEKQEPEPREKKEPKLQIRDLKPKKEVKGGSQHFKKSDPRSPGSKGEMDFMGWD